MAMLNWTVWSTQKPTGIPPTSARMPSPAYFRSRTTCRLPTRPTKPQRIKDSWRLIRDSLNAASDFRLRPFFWPMIAQPDRYATLRDIHTFVTTHTLIVAYTCSNHGLRRPALHRVSARQSPRRPDHPPHRPHHIAQSFRPPGTIARRRSTAGPHHPGSFRSSLHGFGGHG